MIEAGINTDAFTFQQAESRPVLHLVSQVIVAAELDGSTYFSDLSGNDQIPFGD